MPQRDSKTILLLILLATFPVGATGQIVIAGSVTDSAGMPLAGANVSISSLALVTGSTADGSYRLQLAPPIGGDSVTVQARRVGYSPQSRRIAVTRESQVVDFVLAREAQPLRDVVVTGVADTTRWRNLTITVGRVAETQLADVPPASVGAALAGKVAGVRVAFTQGEPGASPAIRIRTSSSLGVGKNAPLVLIDGIVMKNGIENVDANDIERIEVLKGAASANTYGSDAANGVVAVYTRRGRDGAEGKASFFLRTEIGRSSLERYIPMSLYHPFDLNADGSFKLVGGQRSLKADHYVDAQYPAGTFRDQLRENLRNGEFSRGYARLSFRRGNTSYAASFSRDADRGVGPIVQGFNRQTVSLALDQGIGRNAEMSVDLRYGLSRNDQPVGLTDRAQLFSILFAQPDVDLTYPNGPGTLKYAPILLTNGLPGGNPLYDLANRSYNERREHLLGSFSLRYRLSSWLTLVGRYGTDRLNTRVSDFYDRGLIDPYFGDIGRLSAGTISLGMRSNAAFNAETSALARFSLGRTKSATRLSYQYEDERRFAFNTDFNRLLVASVPDLQAADPASLASTTGSSIEQIRGLNYFVTQDLSYDDRYFVQLLGRRDGSSLFGSSHRWHSFSGVSAAWRVTSDFHIPGVQELKVRVARGTAGLRPGFADQYETFYLRSGTISKADLGNRRLEPAVQTESEFGINARFANRVEAEFVKSDRHTDGAFLQVPLSAAQSGGFTSQWQNAARIGGRTFEISLRATIIDQPGFTYSMAITGDRSRQKIDQLGRPPFRVDGSGVFFYRSGETMGVIYGDRWIRTIDELKENPLNVAVDPSAYVLNDDGYLVLATCRGKPCERPIAYVDTHGVSNVRIGDANPDFSFGLSNTAQVRRFRFHALLDGTRGGNIYNSTKQGLARDLRSSSVDQSGKPAESKKAIDYYSIGLYDSFHPNSYYVENGSYMKLRELSVSRDFGKSVRVALIGRNLKTWTRYTGFDPEAAEAGDFNLRVDALRYPSLRQLTAQIELKL